MATNTRASLMPPTAEDEDPLDPTASPVPPAPAERPAQRGSDVFDQATARFDPRALNNPVSRRMFGGEIAAATKAASLDASHARADAIDARREATFNQAQADKQKREAEKELKAKQSEELKKTNAEREAQFVTHNVEHYTDAHGVIQPARHPDGRVRFNVGEDGKRVLKEGKDPQGGHYRVTMDAYGDKKVEDANEYRVFDDEPSVIYRGGKDSSKKPNDRTGWEKFSTVDEAKDADSPELRGTAEAAKAKLHASLVATATGEAERERIAADLGLQQWRQQRVTNAQRLKQIETEAASLAGQTNDTEGGILGFGKKFTPNAEAAKKRLAELQSEETTLRTSLGDYVSEEKAIEADPVAAALVQTRAKRAAEIEGFTKLAKIEKDPLRAARKFRELLPENERANHPILVALAAEKERLKLREPTDIPTSPEEREAQLKAWEASPDARVQALAAKHRAVDAEAKSAFGTGAPTPEQRMAINEASQSKVDLIHQETVRLFDTLEKEQADRQAKQAQAIAEKRMMEARGMAAGRALSQFGRVEGLAMNPEQGIGAAIENAGLAVFRTGDVVASGGSPLAKAVGTFLPNAIDMAANLDPVRDLEARTQEKIKTGMEPKAARAAARKELLGGIEQQAGGPDGASKWASHAAILDGGAWGISPATHEFIVSDEVYRTPAKVGALKRAIRAKEIPGLSTDTQVADALALVDKRIAHDESRAMEQARTLPGWDDSVKALGSKATDKEVYEHWRTHAGLGEIAVNALRKLPAGAVSLAEGAVAGADLWIRDKANAVAEWAGTDFAKTSPEKFGDVLTSLLDPKQSLFGKVGGQPNPRLDGVLSEVANTVGQQIPGWIAAYALAKVPGGKAAAGKAALAQNLLMGATYGLQNAASNYDRIFQSMVTRDDAGNIVAGADEAHKAALAAFNSSFAVGVTELAPLERVFEKIPVGKFQVLVKTLKETAAEVGQEVISTQLNNVITQGHSTAAMEGEELSAKSLMAMVLGMGAVIAPTIALKSRSQAQWLTKNAEQIAGTERIAQAVPAAWQHYTDVIAPTPAAVSLGALDPADPAMVAAVKEINAASAQVAAAKTLDDKVAAYEQLHASLSTQAPALQILLTEGPKSAILNEVAGQIEGITAQSEASRLEDLGIAPSVAAQYATPAYVQRQKDRASGLVKQATGRADLMSKAEEEALATDGVGEKSTRELVYDHEGAPIIEERARKGLIALLPATAKLFPATEVERKVAASKEKKAAEVAKAAPKGTTPPPAGTPPPFEPVSEKDEIPMGPATPAGPSAPLTPEQDNAVNDLGNWLIAQGVPAQDAAALASEFVPSQASLKKYSRSKHFSGVRTALGDFVQARGFVLGKDGHFTKSAVAAPAPAAGAAKPASPTKETGSPSKGSASPSKAEAAPKAEKPKPKGSPNTPPPAHITEAKVRKALAENLAEAPEWLANLHDFVTEGGEGTGGMWVSKTTARLSINLPMLSRELDQIPSEQHEERLRLQVGEEITHQIQLQGARRVYAREKKKGEDFTAFLERWYGEIWREEIDDNLKIALNFLRNVPGETDGDRGMEVVRALIQQKKAGTQTEALRLFVRDLGARTARILKAMLDVFRDAAASGKGFGKRVSGEMAAIEAILSESSKAKTEAAQAGENQGASAAGLAKTDDSPSQAGEKQPDSAAGLANPAAGLAKTDDSPPQASITEAANEAATSPTNDLPEPTQAQKEAGNYKLGHIKVAGMDISIENPAGSERKGVDKDGKPWSVTMKLHYGYIKRTEGVDGDHLDVFVRKTIEPDWNGKVWVVDQINPDTKQFDEHKVILGAGSLDFARRMYLANYSKGWGGFGGAKEMTVEEFKAWMDSPASREPVTKLAAAAPAAAASPKKKLQQELESEIARREGKKGGKKSKPPPAPKPEPREIGKNAAGFTLYEDERGVRAYQEGPFLFWEPVGIVPGGGMSINRKAQYLTAEERAGDAPAPAPTEPTKPAESPAAAADPVQERIRKAKEAARKIIEKEGDGGRLASAPIGGAPARKRLSPEALQVFSELADALFEGGIDTPEAFAKEMVDSFGDTIGPQTIAAIWGFSPAADINVLPPWAQIVEAARQTIANPPESSTLPQDEAGPILPGQSESPARGPGSGRLPGDAPDGAGRAGGVEAGLPADADATGGAGAGGGELPGGRPSKSGERSGRGPSRSKAGSTEKPDSVEQLDRPPVAGTAHGTGRGNYHLTNPAAIVGGGPKTRFGRNQRALEVLDVLQTEQREPTQAELDTLAAYTGWGSFGQALFQGSWEREMPQDGWEKESAWLRERLGKEAWESAATSIINAHYTDPVTVDAMWKMVENLGFKGGRVNEPGMGIGNFYSLMPRDLMAKSTLNGIELDRTTGEIAKALHPQVNVSIMGYQDSQTADGFYDLTIGNWPFYEKGPADRRYNHLEPTLHDYYFLKALDKTRPGGIVIGITSSGTMDKKNPKVRRAMHARGELIGAIRLPTGAFGEYAGTAVVTDILIFKRRAPGETVPREATWLESKEDPTTKRFFYNEYYHKNPGNIIGDITFGTGTTRKAPGMIVNRPTDAEFLDKLKQLTAALPEAYTPYEPRKEVIVANATGERRQNSVVIQGDELYQVQGEQLSPLEDARTWKVKGAAENKKRLAEGKGLIGLREAVDDMMTAYRNGADTEVKRVALRKQYDKFVKDFGRLVDSKMLKIFERVNDPTALTLKNLEDGQGLPRAILERDIMRLKAPTGAGSIEDAYAISRNNSITFDLAAVAELAGIPEEAAKARLIELDQIFQDPTGPWQARDEYLSGNVRRKLREARDASERGMDMARNIAALEAIQPADIAYFDIEVQMGAAWIPPSDYEAFIGKLLNGGPGDVQVLPMATGWRALVHDRIAHSDEARNVWGHPSVSPSQLFTAAMNGTSVTVKEKDSDGNLFTDVAETEKANGKIEAIREELGQWLWADPDRTARLTTDYNEVMNSLVTPQRDGSHLRFEGLALTYGNGPLDFRKHQRDAVWRFIQDGRGVGAHEVGTGKTFTMAGLSMEGRRLGRFRKPLLFAHNANYATVYADFQAAYPAGKFLLIDSLNPAERESRMRQIAMDEWDAIIVPHSLINRFTLRGDTMRELAAAEIAALEDEIYGSLSDLGVGQVDIDDMGAVNKALGRIEGSHTAKDLVKSRLRILDRILKKEQENTREDALFFEDLGVDAVMVDEAHIFKKVALATRKQIKGLSKDESGVGFSLSLLTDYVKRQNTGRGVFLFTGTPITNTLNEAYNMMRYVMDDSMKEAGIKKFDDWLNAFATSTVEVERTAGGTYEAVERLRSFINVTELARMASQYFDVVQAKAMPEFVARPTSEGIVETLEKPKGRPEKRIVTVISDPSAEQAAFNIDLQERYKAYKKLGGKEKRHANLTGGDTPIKMNGDGSNSSLDHRLIDHHSEDAPGSKVNIAIKNIMGHWREHPKATQMVFMERGWNDYTDSQVIVRGEGGFATYDDDGKSVKTKERRRQFNLVRDMVQKLMDQGVRPEQIAIFGNMKLDPISVRPGDPLRRVRRLAAATSKEDLAALMRTGDVKLAIGGTESMGTGVNAQDYLRAVHHLDAPWMPGSLEQRNGRIHRQGNRWNTVFEYRYYSEGSHDAKKWGTLLDKVRFIHRFTQSLLTGGNSGPRVLAGDGADTSEDGSIADFEESFAASAGDPRLLVRTKLTKEVEKLERRRNNHLRAMEDARRSLLANARQDERDVKYLAHMEQDAAANAEFRAGDWEMEILGTKYTVRTEADEALKRLPTRGTGYDIGTMGPFKLHGNPGSTFWLAGPSGEEYIVSPSTGSIEGVLRYIPRRIADYKEMRAKRTTSNAALSELLGKPFGRQAELDAKKESLAALENEIWASPVPAPSWLRVTVPANSLVYVRQADGEVVAKDVVAHRWDKNGWWILIDENDTMVPIRYTEALDESGTPIFEPREFFPPPNSGESAAPEIPIEEAPEELETTAPAPAPAAASPAASDTLFPMPERKRNGLNSRRDTLRRLADEVEARIATLKEEGTQSAEDKIPALQKRLARITANLHQTDSLLRRRGPDDMMRSAPLSGTPEDVNTWTGGPLRYVGMPEDILNRGTVGLARWGARQASKGAHALQLPRVVAKISNSRSGEKIGQALQIAQKQLLPKTLLAHEAAAWLQEARSAIAWSARSNEELMNVIKTGGESKYQNGFVVPQEGTDSVVQREMSRYFRGEIPITALPPAVHDWAKAITKLWDERGKAMVDAGLMTWETYSARRAAGNNYFPHLYVSEELNNTGIRWTTQKLKMYLDRTKPQLSTAWYIKERNPQTGQDVTDRFGVPRLLEHVKHKNLLNAGQWRFNSEAHRDQWFEGYVKQEIVSRVRRHAIDFSIADLDALALQSPATAALVASVEQDIRARWTKGSPTDLATLERSGLITNLAYVVPKSLAQMDHDIALARLFSKLADEPRFTSDAPISGFTEIPNDHRFGKLAGRYVEDTIAQEILELHGAPDLAWQIYDAALSEWKTWKTVYNPGTHFRNVVGNFFFSDLAGVGVTNPANWGVYKDAWTALKGDLPEAPLPELYEAGVLGGDFATAELHGHLKTIPFENPDGSPKSPAKVFLSASWRKVKGVGQGMRSAYDLEDSLFKVASYIKARRSGMSVPEATAHVRRWFPFYDQVGRSTVIRNAKRFTSPFLSFMQEAVRIGGQAMLSKPITFAKWLAIPNLISMMSRYAMGIDDDDWEAIEKNMRGQVGGHAIFSALLPWKDSEGRPAQWDLTNVIPYADMLGQRMGTSRDVPMWSAMIHKYFLSGPATQLAIAWGQGNDPFTGRKFQQPDMTAGEVLRAQLGYSAGLILPPLTPGVGTADIVSTFTRPAKEGRQLEERNVPQELIRKLMGFDIRGGLTDLRASAEAYRKANGLPAPADFQESTFKSRTRREVYSALVNGDVESLAENLVQLRERSGDAIRTPQDINRLFYYRDPGALIPKKADREAWIRSLSKFERESLQKARADFERAKRLAPALLRQAEALRPELKAPRPQPLRSAATTPFRPPGTQAPQFAGRTPRTALMPV